jgi:hypothetical protein
MFQQQLHRWSAKHQFGENDMIMKLDVEWEDFRDWAVDLMAHEDFYVDAEETDRLVFKPVSGLLAVIFGGGRSRFSGFRLYRAVTFLRRNGQVIVNRKPSFYVPLAISLSLIFSWISISKYGVSAPFIAAMAMAIIIAGLSVVMRENAKAALADLSRRR